MRVLASDMIDYYGIVLSVKQHKVNSVSFILAYRNSKVRLKIRLT